MEKRNSLFKFFAVLLHRTAFPGLFSLNTLARIHLKVVPYVFNHVKCVCLLSVCDILTPSMSVSSPYQGRLNQLFILKTYCYGNSSKPHYRENA